MNNIIWWGTEEFSNYGKLVDVILSWEQRLALKHLSKDASSTPDINLNIILLPCKHNLRCSVISGGDITSHLGILNTGKTEIANLEIAVLVDKDVAGLQIAMNDTCGVDILQSSLFGGQFR